MKKVFCPHCHEEYDIKYLFDHLQEYHGYLQQDFTAIDRLKTLGILEEKEAEYLKYVMHHRIKLGKKIST